VARQAVLLSRRALAQRCFPSHSPTLRPWIVSGRVAHSRPSRPAWRGLGARFRRVVRKTACKSRCTCQSAISHADAPSTFSLRRGLDSI
jgi:hypothetical protein